MTPKLARPPGVRERLPDGEEQWCYRSSLAYRLLREFRQGFHPPRYAAFLTPPSPIFPHSSSRATQNPKGSVAKFEAGFDSGTVGLGQDGGAEPQWVKAG